MPKTIQCFIFLALALALSCRASGSRSTPFDEGGLSGGGDHGLVDVICRAVNPPAVFERQDPFRGNTATFFAEDGFRPATTNLNIVQRHAGEDTLIYEDSTRGFTLTLVLSEQPETLDEVRPIFPVYFSSGDSELWLFYKPKLFRATITFAARGLNNKKTICFQNPPPPPLEG